MKYDSHLHKRRRRLLHAFGEGGGSLQRMLFGNGEDGFLFYPASDLTRLFTTSQGPTNVAANDDPAGLWLDNHSWGGATYSTLVAGQTERVSNGSFGTDTTGWTALGDETLSVVAGRLRITFGADGFGGGSSGAYQAVSGLTVGASYLLQCGGRYVGTNGAVGVRVTNSAGGGTAAATFYGFSNATGEAAIFVASATTMYVQVYGGYGTAATYVEADDISLKRIPGNHALNATSTQRPLYKTNSGKPYLNFDGTDDRVVSPFIPTTATTLALACRWTSANGIMLGGGISATGKRAYIGTDASGYLLIGWGTAVSQGNTSRVDNDLVVVVTGDGSSRDVYVDGVLQSFSAPSGGPDGGGAIAFGAWNNNGSASNYSAGRGYAALALNRRVTPAEISRITSEFQRTYQ